MWLALVVLTACKTKDNVESLQAQVAALEARVAAVEAAADTKADATGTQASLDALGAQVAAVEAAQGGVDEQVSDLLQRVESVEDDQGELGDRLGLIEDNVTNALSRLDDVEATVLAANSTANNARRLATELEARVEALEASSGGVARALAGDCNCTVSSTFADVTGASVEFTASAPVVVFVQAEMSGASCNGQMRVALTPTSGGAATTGRAYTFNNDSGLGATTTAGSAAMFTPTTAGTYRASLQAQGGSTCRMRDFELVVMDVVEP